MGGQMIWERDLPQGSIIRPSGHTPRIDARANAKRSGAAQDLTEPGFRHFYAVLAGLDPAMG
jgi:hypothetical protein